jgi:hypothetical protein
VVLIRPPTLHTHYAVQFKGNSKYPFTPKVQFKGNSKYPFTLKEVSSQKNPHLAQHSFSLLHSLTAATAAATAAAIAATAAGCCCCCLLCLV